MTTRVDPVRPPYPRDIAERLEAMMPPGAPPILLFRTFVRNLPMAAAMSGWGGYELSKRLSLSMRDREIIIDRTCARCRCEYEWGVHVAFFAERAALSGEQITSLTHGDASDPCWTDERDRLLIEAADALHDSADIGEDLWARRATLRRRGERAIARDRCRPTGRCPPPRGRRSHGPWRAAGRPPSRTSTCA